MKNEKKSDSLAEIDHKSTLKAFQECKRISKEISESKLNLYYKDPNFVCMLKIDTS